MHILTLIFVTFISFSAYAITGYEVMVEVDKQSKIHKTQKQDVFMLITDARNKNRKRYFTNKKKVNDAYTKSLIKFYKPATIKGTSLLTHSKVGEIGNKQWIYLPALKSRRQISSKDKGDSFMGSDFSYSDVAGRQVDDDMHTLLDETEKYYIVESVPKDKEDAYSKIESAIDKNIMIPLRVVFYDSEGRKLKTLNNKKFDKVKGMYVVIQSEMRNHLTAGKTHLDISKLKVGLRLTDRDFGIKSLR